MEIKNIFKMFSILMLLTVLVIIVFLMFNFGENKFMRILIGGCMGMFFMLWFNYVSKNNP